MNEFRRQFIDESLGKLAVLHDRMINSPDAATLREAFRAAHTIKGGAQIFELPDAARIAAALEESLAAETPDAAGVRTGIDELRASLENSGESPSAERPRPAPSASSTGPVFTSLPADVVEELSGSEISEVAVAVKRGRPLATVETNFSNGTFGVEFPRFRRILETSAQVIAALPIRDADGGLRYRFVVAGEVPDDAFVELPALIARYEAAVVPELAEVVSRIIGHVNEIATANGRAISTSAIIHPVRLPAAAVTELFEILLHLTRNSAEHAFDASGRIDVRLFDAGDELRLVVADNGRGVELEKVRLKAVEKGMLDSEIAATDDFLRRLIFESGFSTAETVTEFSGRGVGLDAVREAVARLNGEIDVASRRGQTTFTVRFPKTLR